MKEQYSAKQTAAMKARVRRIRAQYRRRLTAAIIIFFILGVVAGVFAHRWFVGRTPDAVSADVPVTYGSEAAEVTPQYLEKIVASRPLHEIYDENNNYLPSVTEEAYLAALDSVLQHADAHYAEVELELALTYTDGRWQVLASPAFLRALNGGAAY